MKKIILSASLLSILVLFFACKKDPCHGTVTYPQIHPAVLNYFFKPGSFWVYKDMASGTIDSQYVYFYQYREHYRNPLDTPDKLYTNPNGISPSGEIYCGPYYLDSLVMTIAAVQNGLAYDTISFRTAGEVESDAAVIYSHNVPYDNASGTIAFDLSWSRIGLLDCCLSTVTGSPEDTSCTWYHGPVSTVSTGSYTFSNGSLWTVQIRDGSSPRFWDPTDLYYVANYGIVKMVTHKPTGDIRWDLVNYHIIK